MRKRVWVPLAAAAMLLLVFGLLFAAMRQRERRRAVFRSDTPRPAAATPASRLAALEPKQWTAFFIDLQDAGLWKELDEELSGLQQRNRALYEANQLGYLHGRARLERGEPEDALVALAPFLVKGHALRDLALHHAAAAEDEEDEAEKASALRQALIFDHPGSIYRIEAIEDELEFLEEQKPASVAPFASRLYPSAGPELRRQIDARMVEGELERGEAEAAVGKATKLLEAAIGDDAAERTARALDRPAILTRLQPAQLHTLGEAMRTHRHYDRAVQILSLALGRLPEKQEEVRFAIGRSHFGAERFPEAQKTYEEGYRLAKDLRMKATFAYHAARCAQLRGDDRGGEARLTMAIAVPGSFPATSAALTQRIRTRLKQGNAPGARSDLALLRKSFPNDHAVVEASLAAATNALARGAGGECRSILDSIPGALIDSYDVYEVAYWRGRSEESHDSQKALAHYLTVLRAPVSTHFAYLARQRLALAPLGGLAAQRAASLRKEAQSLAASAPARAAPAVVAKAPAPKPPPKKVVKAKARKTQAKRKGKPPAKPPAPKLDPVDRARELLTDAILLSVRPEPADVELLRKLYLRQPAYERIVRLEPKAFPHFPLQSPDPTELLMAMGLFDDAVAGVERRYPLRPLESGLTQALAYRRGSASKASILAAEILMKSVPTDLVPELLPRALRELLYPRYFLEAIEEDAQKHAADPQLVLSIMREESRFNPRAKSIAAARGLLQFIITTARDVGREIGMVELEPQDLYDPRIVIRLGAKYVGNLQKEFGGNSYHAVAAYNAGPHQTRLWIRLAPAPGNDYFLSSINFEETRHYVRKVMNSYYRYEEIYGKGAEAVGGMRVEP